MFALSMCTLQFGISLHDNSEAFVFLTEVSRVLRVVDVGNQFLMRSDSETWLILPVVICLSQRLSHACLSISFKTAKLRMAH